MQAAVRLHEALGGNEGLSFLDQSDLEVGQSIPIGIVDALLEAKIVVIFADETYFQRWYCLREMTIALAEFESLLQRGRTKRATLDEFLAHIIVALQDGVAVSNILEQLPPYIRSQNLPLANTESLEQSVRSRLERVRTNIRLRLDKAGVTDLIRAELVEASSMPPAAALAGAKLFPPELPLSIGDRFVGRSNDLWRIHYQLVTLRGNPKSSAAPIVILQSGGGFGKTRLALEYLMRFGPASFPAGLFWVNAEAGGEQLEIQFFGALKLIKPETPDLAIFRESKRSARAELGQALQELSPETPALFVVDNIPEPGPGKAPEPLRNFCPGVGRIPVLATSRYRGYSADQAVRAISLNVLSPEAAALILAGGLNDPALDQALCSQIVEWVGRLPLALVLLHAALRTGALSSGELRALVETRSVTENLDEQIEAMRHEIEPGQLRGVTEALNASYERLPSESQTAARLLAQLSLDPIPIAILKAFREDIFVSRIRTTLVSRSYVSEAQSEQIPVFGVMHSVLADFLRTRSSNPDAEALTVCEALLRIMTPAACSDPQSWPLMNMCFPHARLLYFRMVKAGSDVRAALELSLRIGILLREQAQNSAAKDIQEDALAVAERELGFEHPTTLTIRHNLGMTLKDAGLLNEAREVFEQITEIRTQSLGEDHHDTLASMANLALILRELGEFDKADELEERVAEFRLNFRGADLLEYYTTLSNLGTSLHQRGKLTEARALLETVLDARVRLLGPDHPETLASMTNLATTLHWLGRFDESLKIHQEVLATSSRVLGTDHRRTLNAMDHVGRLLNVKRRFDDAKSLQEGAVKGLRRVLGERHPDTLIAANSFGMTLVELDKFSDALREFARIAPLFREVLGQDHDDTLAVRHNMAICLSHLNKKARARRIFEEVLTTREKKLGDKHPSTTLTAFMLLQELHAGGRQANRVFRKYLKWLVAADPSELHFQVQGIRTLLISRKAP